MSEFCSWCIERNEDDPCEIHNHSEWLRMELARAWAEGYRAGTFFEQDGNPYLRAEREGKAADDD